MVENYDFLKFINSRAICTHVKEIGYEFSETEKAYIVYESFLPLKEKHEAYGEIIKNTSDEKLGTTLTKRMELEKILLDVFFQSDNAVYLYRYIDKGSYEASDEVYRGCTKCMESAFYWEETAEFVRIEKRWISGDNDETKKASALFNKKGEVINVSSRGILNEELSEAFWGIIDLWQENIHIPLPFKRGDILHAVAEGVFVYEQDWDKSYMGGYKQNDFENEDAVVGLYSISNWLTAEYYTEKLEGRNEKLGDISSFLKGKMKLVDFIEKCRKMK